MVYLDQNFWIRLTAARQARPAPGFTELLKACERAVDDGRAQFVLSWANYEENWRRGSLSDRCQVAETMERLTAFTTMRTIWRLHEDEVRESLSTFLPVPAPERIAVFGRGIRHLLPFELFCENFRKRLALQEALHEVANLLVERAANSRAHRFDVRGRRCRVPKAGSGTPRGVHQATNRAGCESPSCW